MANLKKNMKIFPSAIVQNYLSILLIANWIHRIAAQSNITEYDLNFTTTFYDNWTESLIDIDETDETDDSFPIETNIESVPLFSEIASERRQIMGWDLSVLEQRFQQSKENKSLFLMILREEFRKTKALSERQKFTEPRSESVKPIRYSKMKGRLMVSLFHKIFDNLQL